MTHLRRCRDLPHLLDCHYLPHGPFTLPPAVLATMAFWTTFSQDGCDYAKLTGSSVENITSSDVYPYLEVGRKAYRHPFYYAESSEWSMLYTDECSAYPDAVDQDAVWQTSKAFVFISAVIGGALALFLWFIVCFTVSKRTWRMCAITAMVTGMFRIGSFFFFVTDICNADGSNCELSFGSRMDIVAIVLWLMTGLCLLGYYPNPKLRRLTNEELEEELEREMAQTHAGGGEEDVDTMSFPARRLKSGKDSGVSQSKKKLQPFQYPTKRPPSSGSSGEERTMASQTYTGGSRTYAESRSYTPESYGMMSKSYVKGSRPTTPLTHADERRSYTPLSYPSKSFT